MPPDTDIRPPSDRPATETGEAHDGASWAPRLFVDARAGALLYIDGTGVIRGWTASAARLFGYSSSVAVGRALTELVPFAGRAPNGWCVRGDGVRFFGELVPVALDGYDDDGPLAIAVRDVTARHELAESERAVRARLDRLTANLAKLVLFTIDVTTHEVVVSDGLAELLGWTRGALPQRVSEFLALIPAEQRTHLSAELERAAAERGSFEIELCATADLGQRWIRVGGTFAAGGGAAVDGEHPRLVGTALDVTARHLADEALRQSDAKLHAVLDATIDAIITIDEAGHIASANRTAATMFRCAADALVGAPFRNYLEVRGPLPAKGELHHINGRRADGSTFPVECGLTEVLLGAHRLVICVVRDITERRLLERQVLDVSEQLQRQIGQDLHDGLGQLLTGTAFLAKGLESQVASAYQPQAQRVVELINQAINRVRSLARGLSPIHVEAQSLEAVMRHVVAESSKLLGVPCVLKLDGDVESDRPATVVQLCLITREAITNAVRHGQARRIVVTLSRDDAGSHLTIVDDGLGINESAKSEGLGLRSMHHRAHMIGGTLSVARGAVSGTVVRCSFRE